MKRLLSIFCIFLLVGTTSCLQESSFENNTDVEKLEVRIRGDIEHRSATKADDKGFYDGDAFGVYIINSSSSMAPTGNIADNVRDLEDPNAYPFEVSKDQRKPAANGILGGYEASDFLYAVKSDVTPTSDVISLLFKHKFANMKVTLLEGAGWADGEWNLVSKDVLVTNTIRQALIDLADGSVQTEGSDRSMGIVPLDMGNDIWRAVVIPQEIPAGSPILSITIDGQSRDYTWDTAYYYYDGKQNSITLSVNKNPDAQGIDLVLVSEGITPWEEDANVRDESTKDYLVIQCLEAGKLKETILAAGYQLESIKNLKIEGAINVDDFYFMRDELPILQAVNLMSVIIAEGMGFPANCIPNNAFYAKKSLMTVVYPKVLKKIGDSAFSETALKGDIVFPEGLVRIDNNSFSYIPTLNGTITFPETIREIGNGAFCGTTIRGDLFLPEGLELIESVAFRSTNITSVSLPSTLKYLGACAFQSCFKLKGSLAIPSSIKTIEMGSFDQAIELKGDLSLPEGLETIDAAAFSNCPFSGPLDVPSSVKYIGDGAFGNNKFSSISLPESLEQLGTAAFSFCGEQSGALFDLKVPDSISIIPASCFSGNRIKTLTLGKNIEEIQQEAFSQCYNISSIICESPQPPVLGSGVFDGVAKDNFALEVPESSVELYQNAPGWSEFKRIVAHRDFSISRRLLRTLPGQLRASLIG